MAPQQVFCTRGFYNVFVHGLGFMALFTAFQVRMSRIKRGEKSWIRFFYDIII